MNSIIKTMYFKDLGLQIKKTHEVLQIQAGKAVNSYLTARNWIIGYYIIEYQQKGNDRAVYGDNLITDLAKEINIKGLSTTNLKLSRQFYTTYSQLNQVVSEFISHQQIDVRINLQIGQSANDQLQIKKSQSLTDQLQIDPKIFLNNISFTHIAELLKIDEPLNRFGFLSSFFKMPRCNRTQKQSISTFRQQSNAALFELFQRK